VLAAAATGVVLAFGTAAAGTGSGAPEAGAIGRLIVGGERQRLCTSFIVASERVAAPGPYGWQPVWKTLAVSAGHCFGPDMKFHANPTPMPMRPDRRAWYPAQAFTVRAVAVSRPPEGYDLMVVAFESSWQLPALRIAGGPPERGEVLLMVGYGGRVLGAVSGRFLGTDGDGSLMVGAYGIKGYSGSPVLRADGTVVGVAVAAKLKEARSPIECLLGGSAPASATRCTTPSQPAD